MLFSSLVFSQILLKNCLLLTFVRYIRIYHTFGLLDCNSHNEDFVILRFCPIYFNITLAGLKSIVRHTEDFVIWGSLNRCSTVVLIRSIAVVV